MKTRLDDAERGSAAWHKVRTEIERRLKEYRLQVELPTKPEAERLGLCWRIQELLELLRIEQPGEDRAPAPESDAGY